MNSTLPRDEMGPPICQMQVFLGGRLPPSATEAKAVLTFLTIINILVIPLTIVLNAMVIAAVKTKSRMRANKSNILLACLATTDLMVGVVVQPLFTALLITIIHGVQTSGSCIVEVAAHLVSNLLCVASLIHVALISGERFLAIKCTYAYNAGLVTETRLLIASGLGWLLALILYIPLFIDKTVFYRLNNAFVALCLATIVLCNITVFREVHRHEKGILSQQVTEDARRKLLKEKRAFKLIAIIFVMLFLCYMPLWILKVVLALHRNSMATETAYKCSFVTATFVMLNSLVNPLIYSVRVRQFRVVFVELVCRTANTAEAEQIERRLFGTPNTVVRLELVQQCHKTIKRGAGQELDSCSQPVPT